MTQETEGTTACFDPDPARATEVEVTFVPEGAGMRTAVASDGGWPEHLEWYRRAA